MPEYVPLTPKVHRRDFTARVRRRRTCTRDVPYFPVTWTIPSPAVDDFGPRWVADRDYWIGGVMAAMDANAGGSDLRLNIRRINTGGGDAAVLASDSRIRIATGSQTDAATNGTDADLDVGDFAIEKLFRGERVYPRITQFGTGDRLEVTLQLVPIRTVT